MPDYFTGIRRPWKVHAALKSNTQHLLNDTSLFWIITALFNNMYANIFASATKVTWKIETYKAILIPETSGSLLSAVGRLERLWDNGIDRSASGFLVQNSQLLHKKVNQKKEILFEFPRVSSGDQLRTKKPEDSGIKIAYKVDGNPPIAVYKQPFEPVELNFFVLWDFLYKCCKSYVVTFSFVFRVCAWLVHQEQEKQCWPRLLLLSAAQPSSMSRHQL